MSILRIEELNNSSLLSRYYTGITIMVNPDWAPSFHIESRGTTIAVPKRVAYVVRQSLRNFGYKKY